ncbi:O-linked N-acetylglucosamine transferase, SPINDLY family protein [Oculatella sp. LEGE 06141]|uniref:O-linked N-acetylglucosamine transferase, SPINDLY family protein n=1 Tax=Oculatella sp. LEGE 06141 TaxID=1828648 RepID=UPI00187E2EA0|nr:tetratricopeptide repeat protein [Oculatella sp. LEGE 06141]MBE9177200.1 O-linked N-acetylglucosamine transferase, SPINDLY family protein [Oculatella sp. LEGE 06141]
MTFTTVSANDLQQQAFQHLNNGDYEQAAHLYEQAIEQEPENKSHVWHLGLALLLQGQEAEAQTAWWLGMADGEPEQIDQWTTDLLQVLQTEAERREQLPDHPVAWAIRQHMREIAPQTINNLLKIVQLSLTLTTFSDEMFDELELIELLQAKDAVVDPELLLQTLQTLLEHAAHSPSTLALGEASIEHAHNRARFVDAILRTAIEAAHGYLNPDLACLLGELCLRFEVFEVEVMRHLSTFYQNAHQYTKAIETAQACYELTETLADRVYANHLVLKCLMGASGYLAESRVAIERQEELVRSLLKSAPDDIDAVSACRLFISTFFFPYFKDDPATSRPIQNQLSSLCQSNIQRIQAETTPELLQRSPAKSNQFSPTKKLKIGYLSHCLKRHSVGWISRWLFQHHNRERFQIHTYLINQPTISAFTQQWFVDQSDHTYGFMGCNNTILERIHQDEIDILIDLDSVTLDGMCELLSAKVAPIQATWLGWDASGLPAVDYFIADPYVLPEAAQDYYSETIWRLPQTYVAVDGFEVGIPNLRREQLNIPSDAIIYLVVQGGYKRHPENVRLQMKILRDVPNSYLLIKGGADQESSKRFYEQIAEEEGVASDRLRFLSWAVDEAVHRANLGIADVVLDTFPYNGATTTLETLWMGVPLVTQVGQQFAARNSYTMMMNVGVTEGIAWSSDEYVEWGIRLGQDATLRQQISWKLRQSRQTSPLWNTKQFAHEMEAAYEQMWLKFIESK